MDPMGVMLLISLVSLAISTGMSVNQIEAGNRNSDVRNAVGNLMSTINSEVSAKRVKLNKVLALLQSKNSYALMNYMYNNPNIARNLEAIQRDGDLLASIQAEQNAIEAEINSLTNELNSLGYNQGLSRSSSDQEYYKVGAVNERLKKSKARYDALNEKAANIKLSTTNPVHVHTSDIDARSQNINGGMK